MRWTIAAALALSLLLSCASTPIHTRTWYEARTPNFTIWSCQSPEQTLELARDLELFRSVVEFVTGQHLPTSPVPVHVYAFDTASTYRPFAIEGAGGHFEQSMRDNTIVLANRSVTRTDPTHVIQHEYVHYLLENHADFVYPPWYHEGFAEFLGSVRVKGDRVEIGAVPRGRMPALSAWTPLSTLLGIGVGDRATCNALYGQSWALVHYLNFGRQGQGNATRQLTRYLRSVEKGTPVSAAVEDGFGVSVERLDRDLRRYVRKRRFRSLLVDLETFDVGSAPALRVLSSDEVALALGRLSLKRGRHEQALGYFQEASTLDPANGQARAGMGDAYFALEQWEAGEAEYGAALEMGPDDALIHLGFANHLYERASRAQTAEERSHLAREARSHYVTSWKLDDSIPETYARYGMTFLLEGEETQRGLKTLEHAYQVLPSSTEIRIQLAEMQLALGRPEQARQLALSAWGRVYDDAAKTHLQSLLDQTGGVP